MSITQVYSAARVEELGVLAHLKPEDGQLSFSALPVGAQ